MALVRATVTCVPNGRGLLGAKRTIVLPPRNVNAPLTGAVPAVTLNDAGVTVPGSMTFVNVT